MVVEQSIKAVLIALRIDFPRAYNVGGVFVQLANRDDLSLWFKAEVFGISKTISESAKLR